MLREAQMRLGGDTAPAKPSQATWTPEMSALANLNDAVQNLTRVTVMANSGKGKQAPQFNPYPRPESALERAITRTRWEKHEALADRLLGRNLTPEQRAQAEEEGPEGPAAPVIRR